ncbi:MAG: hypothetical protein JXR83_22410 [Deltaproteobacteria bacterium]|nr:hypothetical protein [Deltaproteobacteria bacterium]
MVISLIPWLLGAFVVVSIAISLVYNVSGTWERMPSEEELAAHDADPQEPTPPAERVVLGQFGPFVTGRRDVAGGWQEFKGLMLGPTLRMTRRDHGVPALCNQGFPESIAKMVNGDITGRLKLGLTSAGLILDGTFTPQKIEFTHRPPKITRRYFLQPKSRRYRRLTAEEIAAERELLARRLRSSPS